MSKLVIDRFDGTEYGYMSNFSPHPVTYLGDVYPTSEHAYQAMKTKDLKERKWVRDSKTPYIAKRRGRDVTLVDNWDNIKVHVMQDIVMTKFSQHEGIALDLASTCGIKLIEGNTWHDNFFGTCKCSRCGDKGQNHLGRILMITRSYILSDAYTFTNIVGKMGKWFFYDESEDTHGPFESKLEAVRQLKMYCEKCL